MFSGKPDNSILGVVNKDYEAAAVANSVLNRMLDHKVFDPPKIRSIYKSETFPTTGYGNAYNLDPKLVERIKKAFFEFPWEGSALAAEIQRKASSSRSSTRRMGRAAQDRRSNGRQIHLQVGK